MSVTPHDSDRLSPDGGVEPPIAIAARQLRKEFVVSQEAGSLKRRLLSRRRPTRQLITALEGIDLTIPAGQTVALVGRNGSGKSTLLSLVGKIYKWTSGDLVVNGRVSPLLELGAGFHHDLTGRENVELNGVILGLTREQVRERFDRIVDFADLHRMIDAPMRSYSSGMQMRLGFAIATHTDCEVLLIDEVLAVGDEEFQEKCYARIGEFQQQGRTILFVSHDMEDVARVAHRVVWLDRGHIRADGPPGPIIEQYLAAAHHTETPPAD